MTTRVHLTVLILILKNRLLVALLHIVKRCFRSAMIHFSFDHLITYYYTWVITSATNIFCILFSIISFRTSPEFGSYSQSSLIYYMSSIITSKGSKAKGHPAGTSKEKKVKPWVWKPNIVAPKTIIKLRLKVNAKWDVDAKE